VEKNKNQSKGLPVGNKSGGTKAGTNGGIFWAKVKES